MTERPRHTSEATFARGRQRREEIVDAATELFAKDGYRGTGLAAIATKVGVTQPTLLHHFGNKEGLLRAVLERRQQEDLAVTAAVLDTGGLHILDALPAYAEHLRTRAGLAHLFAVLTAENLLPEHAAHDWFVQRYRDTRAAVSAAFRAGQQRGEVRADVDPDAVAMRLIALLDGLQTQWLLDPEHVDLEAALKDAASALRDEVRPQD
jgi:AcrR family transcriptional regulator